MNAIGAETISGFNQFILEQRTALPDATLTLVLFNDRRQVVCNRTPIQ
jgi:hypothetical protein